MSTTPPPPKSDDDDSDDDKPDAAAELVARLPPADPRARPPGWLRVLPPAAPVSTAPVPAPGVPSPTERLAALLEVIEEDIADELGVRPDELLLEHFRLLLQSANYEYLVHHGVLTPTPHDSGPHPRAAHLARAWADAAMRLAGMRRSRGANHDRDRSSRRHEERSSRRRKRP